MGGVLRSRCLCGCSLLATGEIKPTSSSVVAHGRERRFDHERPNQNEDMSTDLHYRTPPSSTGKSTPEPESASQSAHPVARLDLSVTKIIGGALAAMTAAALGSQLGVAGTIIGAALASTVAALAGALYTTSLSRTQARVKSALNGRPAFAERASGDGNSAASTSPQTVQRFRVSWRSVVIATLVIFGLAAVALTGVELLTGQPLSGGKGTTISHAAQQDRAPKTSRPDEPDKVKPSPVTSDAPSAPTSEGPTAGPGQPEAGTPDPATDPTAPPTEAGSKPAASTDPEAPASSVPSGGASQNAPSGAESVGP